MDDFSKSIMNNIPDGWDKIVDRALEIAEERAKVSGIYPFTKSEQVSIALGIACGMASVTENFELVRKN